jgi:superfamily II DNA or RNA helicase
MNKRQEIQTTARDAFINGGACGILQVAQRVGKIKISLDIITELRELKELKHSSRILICYPDNRIMDSWQQDIEKWKFHHDGHLTFLNYASLHKYSQESYDMIIYDEVHATSEAQREHMRLQIDTTNLVLGLSGTISADTQIELEELGLKILYKYTVEEAIDDEIIAPYKIYIHTVQLDNIKKAPNKKGKLVSEKQQYDAYTYVIEKMKTEGRDFKFLALHRNRVLQSSYAKQLKTINLLKQYSDKKILVFTGLKKVSESLNIPYYHSTSEHTGVFDDFKTSSNAKLAVVNIGRAGVTFDQLDCIIINSFTGNEETTEQIIARALNRDIEGKIAEIHIICSTEEAELKKLNKSLSSFKKENVIWHS